MKKLPKWAKVVGVLGLVGVIIGGFFAFMIAKHPNSAFTKSYIIPIVKPVNNLIADLLASHPDVEGAKPQHTLSAEELQAAYKKDEAAAKAMYEGDGKFIQVNGIISSISGTTADTNRVILLSVADDPASNISCQMDPKFNGRLQSLSSGSTTSVKGVCIGVKKDDLFGSTDVLLNRCVIVK